MTQNKPIPLKDRIKQVLINRLEKMLKFRKSFHKTKKKVEKMKSNVKNRKDKKV